MPTKVIQKMFEGLPSFGLELVLAPYRSRIGTGLNEATMAAISS
jgi:hypothetical protein